ncbi:MAG: RNA ligase [Myxococcota bacterium]
MDGDPEAFRRALREGHAEELTFEGLRYVRVTGDRGELGRGTVLIGSRAVPIYPSIGRIFVLGEGVRANLTGPFAAEEKIDGYNVRVVCHEGELLAFTRGGYVCPFTTDRLLDLADLGPLFDERPDLVLCAEIAGPHNPYLHARVPHVDDDVALFAFDLMERDAPGFLPFEQRAELLDRHGVPRVPFVGRFEPEDAGPLADAVRGLHAQGSEGVVLKPLGDGRRVKYVTPASNLQDVVEDASLLAELPPQFFAGRLLRLAVGMDELGLDAEAPRMAARLGRALLGDCEEAIREFRRRGVVAQTYTVRLRHEHRADALLERLGTSSVVSVREVQRTRVDGMVELTFRKTFQRATGHLASMLAGKVEID